MKTKILTTICTLMIPIPWTILYLRSFAWALESPAAEITISCYCIFMIFSGLFTILSYFRGKVQNTLMKALPGHQRPLRHGRRDALCHDDTA